MEKLREQQTVNKVQLTQVQELRVRNKEQFDELNARDLTIRALGEELKGLKQVTAMFLLY